MFSHSSPIYPLDATLTGTSPRYSNIALSFTDLGFKLGALNIYDLCSPVVNTLTAFCKQREQVGFT